MLKILLIKTSSLGDVIHQFPAVSDIRAHFPDAVVDWVVEENYAELARLHPGVRDVIPVAVRRWRRNLLKAETWRELERFRLDLLGRRYDLVLDSQGLAKSAIISLLARGPRCGYARGSARESIAALAYDRGIAVATNMHAVERNRMLAGAALGYVPESAVDYGMDSPPEAPSWLAPGACAVLLHATSRADKEWPEADWRALAAELNRRGMQCILPWGNEAERARSERLSRDMGNVLVPPRLGLAEAASMLRRANVVVGVDTGLTHLAAALRTPVIALYLASDPGLTGVYGSGACLNLGGAAQAPRLEEVIAALDGMILP